MKDGNVITGGGVTAGIDFGLSVVAEIAGETVARKIQLGIEYDPAPPFDSGHPDIQRHDWQQAIARTVAIHTAKVGDGIVAAIAARDKRNKVTALGTDQRQVPLLDPRITRVAVSVFLLPLFLIVVRKLFACRQLDAVGNFLDF